MRTTFAIATFLAAANASLFTEVRDAIQSFEPTTRADAKRTIAEHDRHVQPLNKMQRHAAVEAHHSLMARRERLGLPKVGASPVVGQDFERLNSASGFILNVAQGLSYNPGDNQCYFTLEDLIISLDTTSDIVKKLYIPAFWAEAQVQSQDLVAISSATYVDCSLDKVFNTATHLFTTEGASELVGRVAGAFPFEIRKCQEAYNNPEKFTTAERGFRYGKCLSIVLNYTI